MTVKTEMIAAIQAVADASGSENIRIALGAPGNHVENSIGESQPTGAAWIPEPKTWPVVVEGIAAWLDSKGVGGAPGFKNIATLTSSGPVPPTADLVEFGATGVIATLPAANSKVRGTQLAVKDLGFGVNAVAPSGSDTIDGAVAPLAFLPLDAVRLYTDGATGWWTW